MGTTSQKLVGESRFREVRGQRTTREEVDLERAHEPLAIARRMRAPDAGSTRCTIR